MKEDEDVETEKRGGLNKLLINHRLLIYSFNALMPASLGVQVCMLVCVCDCIRVYLFVCVIVCFYE